MTFHAESVFLDDIHETVEGACLSGLGKTAKSAFYTDTPYLADREIYA